MSIRLSKGSTAKKTKVYLVEGYRDENGKSKQRIVKKYGNLEDLKAKDSNILEKLKAQAKEIPKNEVKITLNLSDSNTQKEKDKNYGYFFLENIYNTLEITEFIKGYSFEGNHRYNIDEIMKLLIFGRILKPESKKKTFLSRDEYFTPFKCTINSVYRSLSETYGRDASLVITM